MSSITGAARPRAIWAMGACGVGAVACAGRAGASVVYTPVDLPVNSTTTEADLDFDHDGNTDVEVEYAPPFYIPLPPAGYVTTETNLKVSLNSAATTFATDGTTNAEGGNNAVAFSAGDSIGASLPAGDSYEAANNGGGNLYTPAQTDANGASQSASGNFPASAGEKFIGIAFLASGNAGPTPNYAYIAYETTDDSSAAGLAGEVLGYAYETTPGVAITAGAVPEPGSLALLALGAAGLARYRSSRSRR